MLTEIISIVSAAIGALVTILITEFLRRPRLRMTVSSIEIIPRVLDDDPDETLRSLKKWRQSLGDETRVPIPKTLRDLAEATPQVFSLEKTETCQRLLRFVARTFRFGEGFPIAKKHAEDTLERIKRTSNLTRKDKIEIVGEIVNDSILDGLIVGELRRDRIILGDVPERRKTQRNLLVDARKFSKAAENNRITHGYRLRFPTFFTTISYDTVVGGESDLPKIVPYVEAMQYFHAPIIRKLLKQSCQVIEEREHESLRLRKEIEKLLRTLGIISAEVRIENRGGGQVDISDFGALSLFFGRSKKKIILDSMSKHKIISLPPRSQGIYNFVSKPLESPEDDEIINLFPLKEVLVEFAVRTSGHGFLGLKRIIKSQARMLGENIRKKEEEELINSL